jgi:hypothetical protein
MFGITEKIAEIGLKTVGTETTALIEVAPVLETILQVLKVVQE